MRRVIALFLALALGACGGDDAPATRPASPRPPVRPEACDALERSYDGLGEDCSFSLYSCPAITCLCGDSEEGVVPEISCDRDRCEGRTVCVFVCAERGGDACSS